MTWTAPRGREVGRRPCVRRPAEPRYGTAPLDKSLVTGKIESIGFTFGRGTKASQFGDSGPLSTTPVRISRRQAPRAGRATARSRGVNPKSPAASGLRGSWKVVRKAGLEPARPKTLEPKSSASTNSATRASAPGLTPADQEQQLVYRHPARPSAGPNRPQRA